MKYLFDRKNMTLSEENNKKILMVLGIAMILLFLLVNAGVTWINYFTKTSHTNTVY